MEGINSLRFYVEAVVLLFCCVLLKGNQLKSIEDDPSITPGSVVRSPLSIATIKDTELFNMNPSKSPPPGDNIQPLSLSSSTWSFNPPSSTSSAFTR